jgi:hypothetical protein
MYVVAECLILSEILGFRNLSIVQVSKNKLKKHDVSETGSVSVLRWGKNLFCLFFHTRTMDKVRKPSISESYTPSSESYSNQFNTFLITNPNLTTNDSIYNLHKYLSTAFGCLWKKPENVTVGVLTGVSRELQQRLWRNIWKSHWISLGTEWNYNISSFYCFSFIFLPCWLK